MVQVTTVSVILPGMMLTGYANREVFAHQVRSVTLQPAIVAEILPKPSGFVRRYANCKEFLDGIVDSV